MCTALKKRKSTTATLQPGSELQILLATMWNATQSSNGICQSPRLQMPTASQLAPEYKPTGRFLMFPGGGCRWVEDDEVIPNPFAGGGGGGGPPGGQQTDPMPKAKQ